MILVHTRWEAGRWALAIETKRFREARRVYRSIPCYNRPQDRQNCSSIANASTRWHVAVVFWRRIKWSTCPLLLFLNKRSFENYRARQQSVCMCVCVCVGGPGVPEGSCPRDMTALLCAISFSFMEGEQEEQRVRLPQTTRTLLSGSGVVRVVDLIFLK